MNRIKNLAMGFTFCGTALTAVCAPVTPQQALSRLDDSNGMARIMGKQNLTLCHTERDSLGNAAVYLFSRGKNGGIVLTSADDIGAPLLGYTESGNFDPADIPPAMQWWLRQYSRQIAAAREAGVASFNASSINRESIEPLVTTKWNQSTPFNDECPDFSGNKAMTGCLATALAQIVNYHKWPKEHGNGIYEYTYKKRTFTFDYENTTFDWDNMLDEYIHGEYTPEQAQAVATLMHGVGVGLDMMYGTSASGAYSFSVARALIENFGFDNGAAYRKREYYTDRQWNDLVYDELSTGRPVLYCGVDPQGGHAFVCDGYSENEYFHINWGWGGMSDGYYMLSALNPTQQGIGGSLVGYGFNYYQDIVTGIRPPKEASPFFIPMYAMGELHTTPYTDEESGESATLFYYENEDSEGYVGYYSTMPMTLAFGLKAIDSAGAEKIVSLSEMIDIPRIEGTNLVGLSAIPYDCTATGLPEGRYRVYPVCVTKDGHAQNINTLPGNIDFAILDIDAQGNASFSEITKSPDAEIEITGLTQMTPGNAEVSPTYFISVTNIDPEVSFDGAVRAEIYSMTHAESGNETPLQSDRIAFRLPAGQSTDATWIFNPWVEPGDYIVEFKSDDRLKKLASYTISVIDVPKADLSVDGIRMPEQMTVGKNATISFRVNNMGDIKYEGAIKIRIRKEDGDFEMYLPDETVTVLPGEIGRVSLRWKPTAEAIASTGTYTFSILDKWGRKLTDDLNVGITSGIGSVSAEAFETVDVYNMLGVLIKKGMPASEIDSLPSGIYIFTTEKGSRKVAL